MLDYFQYLFIRPHTVYLKTPKNKEQAWEPDIVPNQEEVSFVNTSLGMMDPLTFEEKTGYILNDYMHTLEWESYTNYY